MTAAEKYAQAKQAKKQAVEAANAVVKEAFHDLAKALFEKHPTLEWFSFDAYTPYFADGDECIFSVHCDYPTINGETDIEPERTYPGRNGSPAVTYPARNLELVPLRDDVVKFIAGFDEEDIRSIFGDHVTIVVKRDGSIETDICEHD